MPRTLPAAWSTGADATTGKPVILVDLHGGFATFRATTAQTLTVSGITYTGDIAGIRGAIGPTIDWRGGLAPDSEVSVRLIQDQSNILTGTAREVLRRWRDFWTFKEYDTTQILAESTYPNDTSDSAAKIRIVWNDATPIDAEAITIFEGDVEDLAIDDQRTLIVSLLSARTSFLDRRFLNRLGSEKSGDENYDSDRTISPSGDKKVIPISYGELRPGRGVFVHDEPSVESTDVSGLVICYSDSRFDCKQTAPTSGEKLYIFDNGRSALIELLNKSLLASIGPDPEWEFVDAVIPEALGFTSGGCFYRFLHTLDSSDDPVLCSAGNIAPMYKDHVLGQAKVAANRNTTAGDVYTDGAEFVDGKPTTFTTFTDETSNMQRDFTFVLPAFPYSGKLYVLALRWRHAHASLPTAFGATARIFDSSGGHDFDGAASPTVTVKDWDNWAGSDDEWKTGRFRITTSPELSTATDVAAKKLRLRLVTTSATDFDPFNIDTKMYGLVMDVVTEEAWSNYANEIYADFDGIKDDGSGTYTGTINAQIELPCDVAYHFIRGVLGETTAFETSNLAATRTDMLLDGLRFDFQIEDDATTPRKMLDKIAKQSMSWIFPTDDGKEKMIYRPAHEIVYTAAETPLSIANNSWIRGTLQMPGLTPLDDVYAGVILRYKKFAPTGDYIGEYRILPSTHHLATNVTETNSEFTNMAGSVRSERVLEVEADLVQDDVHAEKLCKWLFMQHSRRRQLLTWDTWLENAAYLPGDIVAINDPVVRSYSWGTSLDFVLTEVGTGLHKFEKISHEPVGSAPLGTEHRDDILYIEGGANEGSYRIVLSGNQFIWIDSNHTIVDTGALTFGFRVDASYLITSAPVVWSKERGPFIRVTAVENAIWRAGNANEWTG